MSVVVPAILVKSREELDRALARYAAIPSLTDVQIDIVDGQFAKPPTWPYAGNAAWELPLRERFTYDLDLMVREPGGVIDRWVELGANRLTLHVESAHDIGSIIREAKRRHGYEAGFTPGLLAFGLAFNVTTPIEAFEHLLAEVDYVQCMGIATIGRQGEPFDPRVLAKIRALRARHPELPIQVDGGVSMKSAPDLLHAGASRLIVGSVLREAGDLPAAVAVFEGFGEQYGLYER